MATKPAGTVRPGEGFEWGQIHPDRPALEPFCPVKFEAAWVNTGNEEQFLAMMDNIKAAAGQGRFGYIWSEAGRGKTDTTAIYAAKRRLPHIRVREDWKSSTLPFLQKLCRDLGLESPPHSRTRCIDQAIELLHQRPAARRIIFIDEADRIPRHLDLIRDLADLAGAAFIFIGEPGGSYASTKRPGMQAIINENRRVWSRTIGAVRFEAVEPPAIVSYGRASAGLKIEPAAALLVNQALGGGDWRVIRNRVIKMTALANARKDLRITEDLARSILDEELQGGR